MTFYNTNRYDEEDSKGITLNIDAVGFLRALTFSGRGREEEVQGILGEQIRSGFFVA